MYYNESMLELKSPLAILGLVLSTSGIIAGGYVLVERLFTCTLFSIFLTLTPRFLQSFFPHNPTITWLEIRSNRNLYQSWDVAFIYLLLLPVLFFLFTGFWLFLILKVLGVYDLGTAWLGIWFIVLCSNNMWAAVNQYAVEIKAQNNKATVETITQRMQRNPIATLKRWGFYFFRNWIKAPLTTFQLLLTVVLFVLLHWPAWLINGVTGWNINLEDNNARKYYYTGYTVLFLLAGLVLMFLFD